MCVFTEDGHINELGGKYAGLTTKECRKIFVEDLRQCGALVKIEPYSHNVGTCYRCGTTIEPMVSKQWFVAVKDLAEPAIKAVESGRIRFVPEDMLKRTIIGCTTSVTGAFPPALVGTSHSRLLLRLLRRNHC